MGEAASPTIRSSPAGTRATRVGFLRQPAWTAAPIATVLSQPLAERALSLTASMIALALSAAMPALLLLRNPAVFRSGADIASVW
jgi:hypothetical protein